MAKHKNDNVQLDTVIYALQRVNNHPGILDLEADDLLHVWMMMLPKFPEEGEPKSWRRTAAIGLHQCWAAARKAIELSDHPELDVRAKARTTLARVLSIALGYAPAYCVKRKVRSQLQPIREWSG